MLESVTEIIAGKRVRVARQGSGSAFILLHGYPDNLQIWSELVPRLARSYSVIAFDWPGMGESDEWSGGATPFHMAERLMRLMDAWRIEKAHIAGIDMGGQPALVFAANHSDRIHSVTVMNSLVMGDEKTSWEIDILRKFGWNRIILNHLPRVVFARAERTFLPSGLRLDQDLRSDLWASFSRPEVRRFIVRMCAGYQGTLSRLPELYEKIACPTLILWGEKDRHFPPRQADQLSKLISNSKLEIIPDAEHWMCWYRADEVAHRIVDFL